MQNMSTLGDFRDDLCRPSFSGVTFVASAIVLRCAADVAAAPSQ